MSANLSEMRSRFRPGVVYVSRPRIHRRSRRTSIYRHALPAVTEEHEIRFIVRTVMWMIVFAITPLILFYMITYFWPDIFLMPITPDPAEMIAVPVGRIDHSVP